MKRTELWTKTTKETPKDETSVNASLLLRAGFVHKEAAGIYTFLPLGLRVLARIEGIIREEMNALGAAEILMPALQPKEAWQTTGRWNGLDVLFKLKGSGDKEYALGATHEEIVTPLVGKSIASYKDLPVAVYQIQTKFRDEPRAKSGLLRGREFRMKDLYSFHTSENDLDAYYDRVITAYNTIYRRLGIGERTYMTFASGGTFSQYSHEFQTEAPSGEDTIYVCDNCRIAVNKEIIAEQPHCPQCEKKDLQEKKAIEVGNIFKLKTRYSEPFGLRFTDEAGKETPVIMGCYGIGPSRLLGTIVEAFHDDRGILWPATVAPFQAHLLLLSKEAGVREVAEQTYDVLKENGIDVLYDDRADVRAGEKFAENDLMGIPWRLVASDRSLEQGGFEIKRRDADASRIVPAASILGEIRGGV
jgi:prolyl-tRNA synthetase